MKTLYLSIIFLISFSFFATAQIKVGNNPTSINPSAVLDVESSNKGFLPPRVALQSTTDQSTIPSPASGLMVYNTSNAGSENTAVQSNNLYVWTGSKWERLESNSNNSYNNTSPFVIGEIRTSVIVANASDFYNDSGSRTKMTGKAAGNTSTTTRNAAFDHATNNPNWIFIKGLRLDVMDVGTSGNDGARGVFYNTTNSNITYTVASGNGINPYTSGGNTTIVPGAYSFRLDGNDFLRCTESDAEYSNIALCFHDAPTEWYSLTLFVRRNNNIVYFYWTAQRLS